ncbi:TonB-dependent receptor [Emcibacter sp.]|uniref:TonB-dependent receptor n=1 Tax=Emcibacter sp. TaxID=1979954 RepID=UPI002AA88FBD|nr:TonB-dependent receptor [Emcibacter sp.]
MIIARQLLKSLYYTTAASLTLTALASTQASAQSEESAFVLEEITVTARKVEENLQETPIAISAFTGEGLERRQIFRTDDLDNVTPNLQFSNNAPLAGNNNSSQVFIRGIGQTDPTSTVDPGVGIYIDDVYMGQSVGGTMDFRDIAGIQILRGPQGTLFGRNTIGGAILINTQDPGDEFGGTFKGGVGSDNLRELSLAVDVPLGENVKSRFTYGTRIQDGYVIRVSDGIDLGDKNSYTTTGKIVFTPSDDLEIKLQFDYTKADENGSPLVFAEANEDAVFMRAASAAGGCPGYTVWTSGPVPMIDNDFCANDFQNKGPFANNGTNPLKSILENWGTSLHLAYDVSESLTLKSITSYRNLDWEGIRDADNTPLPILHTSYVSDGEQFSQEFQVLYTSDRLTGVTGLYYYEEKIDDIVTVTLSPPPFPTGTLDSDNNLTENDNWAIFSQWSYDITDQLTATLGARYTDETKTSTPDQFSYENPDDKYLDVMPYSQSFDAFTINANISYRWNENVMTYVSYSEGFKSGGWNSHFNTNFNETADQLALLDLIHAFGEETAKNYEIGFKADLLNNTLRLNGAIFSTDYTDLQLVYRAYVAPFLTNAGKASNDGAELELTWLPADNLVIDAGISYLDATIDEVVAFDHPNVSGSIEAGNRLPFAPEWQANIGIGYTFEPEGSDLTWAPRVDLSYQGKTYFDALNTEEIAQDGRTIVNASITLEPSDVTWKFVFGVNNLTDELYPIAGNSSLGTSSGYAEIAYARKREWFANFTYNF